jgi:DNA mismatch repair protein MutS
VARSAGLPGNVLKRAKEILDNLESAELDEVGQPRLAHTFPEKKQGDVVQLGLFGSQDQKLRAWIRDMDISKMTPLDALVELNKLKEHVGPEQ